MAEQVDLEAVIAEARRGISEVNAANEQIGAIISTVAGRLETLKEAVYLLAMKNGIDWDTLCTKARRRVESKERISKEMEAEKTAKAGTDA